MHRFSVMKSEAAFFSSKQRFVGLLARVEYGHELLYMMVESQCRGVFPCGGTILVAWQYDHLFGASLMCKGFSSGKRKAKTAMSGHICGTSHGVLLLSNLRKLMQIGHEI